MNSSIDSRIIDDPDGLPVKYRVSVYPDYDSKPSDADCYTAPQHAAWKNDEWSYVGVTVTPIVGGAWDLEMASASLWGTEYGYFTLTDDDDKPTGEVIIDLDKLIAEHPVPELIVEARWHLLGQLGSLIAQLTELQARTAKQEEPAPVALERAIIAGNSGPN